MPSHSVFHPVMETTLNVTYFGAGYSSVTPWTFPSGLRPEQRSMQSTMVVSLGLGTGHSVLPSTGPWMYVLYI